MDAEKIKELLISNDWKDVDFPKSKITAIAPLDSFILGTTAIWIDGGRLSNGWPLYIYPMRDTLKEIIDLYFIEKNNRIEEEISKTFGVPTEFIDAVVNDDDREDSIDLLISECAKTIMECQKTKLAYQKNKSVEYQKVQLKTQVARQLAALAILAHFQQIKEEDIPSEIAKFWLQKDRKKK